MWSWFPKTNMLWTSVIQVGWSHQPLYGNHRCLAEKNIELCEWWMFIAGKMLEFDWWMFPASHVWLPQGAYIYIIFVYIYIYVHIIYIYMYIYTYTMWLFLAAMAIDQNFVDLPKRFAQKSEDNNTQSGVSMWKPPPLPQVPLFRWCWCWSHLDVHCQGSPIMTNSVLGDFEVNPKSNAPQVKIKFWSARGMDRLPECFKVGGSRFFSISSR